MINQAPPEMYVMSEDRRECYGVIKGCYEFSEDIRFATCSEINFKVAKKYYDIDACEWINNPVYDSLVKHNLIYLADNTDYFTFPNRTIGTYTSNNDNMTNRVTNNKAMTFNQNGGLSGFQLQEETKLFNISTQSGYNWENISEIIDTGTNNGAYKKQSSWNNNFYKVSCINFIPINPYDVIAVRCRSNTGNYISQTSDWRNNNIKFTYYKIHFYTEANAGSYVGTISIHPNKANPIYRFSINELGNVRNQVFGLYDVTISNAMKNGGYIRVSVFDNYNDSNYADTTYPSYYKTETNNGTTTTTMAWSFPYDGWLQIYSGERRCKTVENGTTDGEYNLPMHWFTIVDDEEDFDGMIPTKTIKCYSYEYTLNNRSTSLSGGTLPFYIPDDIINIINQDTWIIDRFKTKSSDNSEVTRSTIGKQYIKRGLLNQILDYLPQWTVAHISSKLMTRYREFDDVDNLGVYNFLTDNVASAYNCYFVFDNDNMTISAYTQDDILNNTDIMLDWNNAIKHLKISNSSLSLVTALRVHTADDTYGLGLVNPCGNSVIYNFDSMLDKMEYIADPYQSDPLHRNEIRDEQDNFVRCRTLREAVESYISFARTPNIGTYYNEGYIQPFENGITINTISDYRECARKFVQANLDYIKAQSKYQEALDKYLSVADRINVHLEDDGNAQYLIPDKPPQRLNKSQSNFTQWHSKELYFELVSAVDNFWDAWIEIHTGEGAVNAGTDDARISLGNQYLWYKTMLTKVAQKLNLNYHKQYELTNNYGSNPSGTVYSILTPREIKALQPYIIEGDWTNENIVFSENYDANDIVDTLIDAMNEAETDFSNIYSKRNYDFEADMINWTAIEEMNEQAKKIKVGQAMYLNAEKNKWVAPILLEVHKNYIDKTDFKMTFTTIYNRKISQFRFIDLYDSISKVSVSDNTFTFDE